MLILYVKTGCPYCAKVLMNGELMGLAFEQKNVADAGVTEELIEKGGKKQEPYLIDTETGVAMYEADDIVAYLKKTYGGGEDEAPQAEPAAFVCPPDFGDES